MHITSAEGLQLLQFANRLRATHEISEHLLLGIQCRNNPQKEELGRTTLWSLQLSKTDTRYALSNIQLAQMK